MAANKSTGNLPTIPITTPRGGAYLRYRVMGTKFGGTKLLRILPAGWNGQFMRLVKR